MTMSEAASVAGITTRSLRKAAARGELQVLHPPRALVGIKSLAQYVLKSRRRGRRPSAASPMPPRRLRVLVLESGPVVADALRLDDRFEVKSVGNAFAAGIEASDFLPNVLLASSNIPGVDSAMCRSIRQARGLEQTKVVIIGDVADPHDINTLLAAGADEFVKKPFNPQKFIARLGELPGGGII